MIDSDVVPTWPICRLCGSEMVYAVPRLKADGGYVHKATGDFLCDDRFKEVDE